MTSEIMKIRYFWRSEADFSRFFRIWGPRFFARFFARLLGGKKSGKIRHFGVTGVVRVVFFPVFVLPGMPAEGKGGKLPKLGKILGCF